MQFAMLLEAMSRYLPCFKKLNRVVELKDTEIVSCRLLLRMAWVDMD